MFCHALTHAREKHRLTKTALASQSGISYTHLVNMETGRRQPTLETVKKLHRLLHFPNRVLLALFDECPLATVFRASLALLWACCA